MIRFKNSFNKIISIVVAVTFLFANTVYGINLPDKTHLRKPLDFSNSEETQRHKNGQLKVQRSTGHKESIGSHHRLKRNYRAPEGRFQVTMEYNKWLVKSDELSSTQVNKLQQAIDHYLTRHPDMKSRIDPTKLRFEIVGGTRLGNTVHDRDDDPLTIQIHRYGLRKDVDGGILEFPTMTLAALEDEFVHFEIEALLRDRQIDNVVLEEALVILNRLLDEITDSLKVEERRSPYSVDWLETTYSGEMANSLSEILSGIRDMLAGGRMPNIFSLLGTLDSVVHDVFGFVTQSYTGEGYEEYGRVMQAYLEDAEQQTKDEKSVKDIFIQMFLRRRTEIMNLVGAKIDEKSKSSSIEEEKQEPTSSTVKETVEMDGDFVDDSEELDGETFVRQVARELWDEGITGVDFIQFFMGKRDTWRMDTIVRVLASHSITIPIGNDVSEEDAKIDRNILPKIAGAIGEIEESVASLEPEVTQLEEQERTPILERGNFQTGEDVDSFLNYLENSNLLGLGRLIQVMREHAEATARPLIGESEDSIIRFVEADKEASAFSFTEDYYSKSGFNYNIRITKGTPLTRFIHELAHFASRDLFPEQYQSYLDSFPMISLKSPFGQLYSAVFLRTIKEEVLAIFMSYEFDQQLKEMGYENIEDIRELEAKEEICRDGMTGLENRIRNSEPQASMFQVNSILFAIEMILLDGKSEANIGKVVFLERGVGDEGVRFSLDMNKMRELLSDGYAKLTGGNLILDVVSVIGPQGIVLALDFLKGRDISSSQFYGIKETLIRNVVDLIAKKIDQDRDIEIKKEVVVDTDLGPRVVPEDRGDLRRITEQPEDSRNLIVLFGTYAAYIDHLLRTDPDSLQQEHILNFIRTIDPERDVRFLTTLLSKIKQDGYDYEKGDFELARALYEKGFKEKAREIFKSWGTSSYRWSPEAVTFLSENGETEILEPYLTSHRDDLSVDRKYFGSEFTPLSFSLANSEEAQQLFGEEWVYIKDLLRVFIVASDGDEYYPDKFGDWWSRNKGRVDLGGQPFDVFSSTRADRYKPGSFSDLYPGGKWMIHPINFIHQALEDPRFRAKAIAMIGEFDDSPMKLKLYKRAAENLPEEWTVQETKEFFEAWSKTLHAVGKQSEENKFMEPSGDFQHWSRFHRYEDNERDYNRKLPKTYLQARLFHHGTKTMIETAIQLAQEREGFEEMRTVAQNLFLDVQYQEGTSFNFGSWYEESRYRWTYDSFFYSANQYTSLWVYMAFQKDSLDIKEFRKMLKLINIPNRKEYDWTFFPEENEFDIAYGRDVKLYVEAMKEMYKLARKFGFSKEAGEIYESVRKTILEAAKKYEDSYGVRKNVKEELERLAHYWVLQEVVQELMARDGQNEEDIIFQRLTQRIEDDTRGFFSTDSIAGAAKELSQREEYTPFALRLFKVAVDKLAPKRGESDWLSKEVREAIKESSLSDEQKDEIYHYALTEMWPQEDHPITRYFGMRDDATESEILIREIFSEEDKFTRSKTFLLEKMARGMVSMNPLKYGKELKRDFVSAFYLELKTLAFLAGNFTNRRELLDPQNYETLKGLYGTKNEALDALESLFPDQVKQDRLRGKHTELPSIAEVEKGNFNVQDLERQLTELLDVNRPEAVWQEAFEVLGAWLRHDALEVINRRQKEEEDKKWDDRQEVFIDEIDLNEKGSYRLVWRLASLNISVQEQSPFAQQTITTLLEAKIEKEATGKAFIAYRVLQSDQAMLATKRLAFEMLAKSAYLPSYVGHVYEERIKEASDDDQLEFFNDVSLWDHTVSSEKRPGVLWVHFLEAKDENKARLRKHLKQYLADPEGWTPDLRYDEDWWILHHHVEKPYSSVGFEQYTASWFYQTVLRRMSIKQRILFIKREHFEYDELTLSYFIDNWERLEDISVEEIVEEYTRQFSGGGRLGSLEDSVRIIRRDFNETLSKFVEYKRAISENREPKFDQRGDYEAELVVFELLRLLDRTDRKEETDLKSLLKARFPTLESGQIDKIYNLAVNPFQTKEEYMIIDGESGWASDFTYEGPSKHWITTGGHNYFGEVMYHRALLDVVKDRLDEKEQNALLILMYPFSKTYYMDRFFQLHESCPNALPGKSYSYRKEFDQKVSEFMLQKWGRYSLEELDEIARKIPAYARTHLARQHQMGLHKVELPENFKEYHEFAVFVIKTYLGRLKIGALEEVSKELKELEPDDALHRFFVLRDMIKPGQLLASRPEVPDRYRNVLSSLEDRVSPSDFEEVRNVIQNQLGWENGEYTLVGNLNAGSMGEVWLVKHKDYQFQLAVKVLTPSKEKKIKETLREMKDLQEILDWYRDISREAAIAYEVLEKLINLLESELDFRRDKENWKLMFGFDQSDPDQRNIQEDGTVPIPGTNFHAAMYFEATEKSLVMSYVDGVNINDREEGVVEESERKALAADLWNYLTTKIFSSENGVYPTDLHSGNIMRTRKTKRNVLIDTGQVGRISTNEREAVSQFLLASYVGADIEQILSFLEQMKHPTRAEQIDREGLTSKVAELLGETGDPIDRVRNLYMQAPFYGLFIDPVYMDLLKGVMTFQGTAFRLDPEFTFLSDLEITPKSNIQLPNRKIIDTGT